MFKAHDDVMHTRSILLRRTVLSGGALHPINYSSLSNFFMSVAIGMKL
jgi:hypothetical protein